MEDIKKYLSDNASEEERTAAERLKEGFSALRIEGKVKAVAAARARAKRQRRNNTIGILLVLLSLSIAIGIWMARKPAASTSFTTEEPVEQETTTSPIPPVPAKDQPVIDTQEKEAPTASPQQDVPTSPPPREIPIAQAELPPPPYGAPDTYLRGQSEENQDKALLDQLWYTGYPLTGLQASAQYLVVDEHLRARNFTTAYVRLQRLDRQLTPNDTLRYLQAYTLLEMGQGMEALALLDELEQPPAAWLPQIEWYRGLAALLADDKTLALGIFREIAKKINHPYQLQAKKALRLYQ
ncbi:hypothetical protein [Lewinella sp. LCG006]|uniref:hypothetical protein n=1 Tax=Lewinella sp. LCG006 TaxID=3231911 RepID=UPI0034609637